MINRISEKLKVLWPPALTILKRLKTIQFEAYSMQKKQEEVSTFPFSRDATRASEKARKSITVVCACIMRDGGQQVLLSMRRAPGVPGLDGKWELPGGKIEFGETPEQALVREIQEELGMRVAPRRLLPYLHTNRWEYEHAIQHVILACYECELEDEGFQRGGDDSGWFHINQIDFNLTLPGTREFVSLAAHNDWFDKVYIQFEFEDSSTNISKQFAVATQSSLFSKYGLVTYWGRTGVKPRTKWQEFTSPRELDKQIFETAKRRLADGYQITILKGPEHPPEVLSRIRELAKQWNDYHPPSEQNLSEN